MSKTIKETLKRFLPAPARTFNKEMQEVKESLKQISARQAELSAEIASERAKLEDVRREIVSVKDTAKQQANLLKCNNDRIQNLQNGLQRTIPQPRLSYFVLNILDHCNLRCRGCDHFAAIAEKRFVALDDIVRDLKKMSELTEAGVTRIGVMGGEPLLHPQLKGILTETRKYFPQTRIELVSNGLLMNQQDDSFWNTCRENRICIVVTKYPLNLDFDKMEKTAREQNVDFSYYGNTGEAIKTSYKMPLDPDGQQNPIENFWNCYHANHLPLLMEGKFYPCTVAPNVRHFNKKFGTDMQPEEGDYLDIHKLDNIYELYQFLATPKPFCRYCKTKERSFGHPWGRSEQKKEEWL